MDDYTSRPKYRSNKAVDVRANAGFGGNFGDGGFNQQMYVSTANMYDNSLEDNLASQMNGGSFPDTSELPSCVKHRNQTVTEEQKGKDSQLPKLLNDLDETCKHGNNEEEKLRLAYLILQAASSPIRKYRLLQFFKLLDSNKSEMSIVKVPAALLILEKYATNLLKDEKHPQWRIVKFNLPIIQNQVFPVQGAVEVLKQMGYTVVTEKALTFPDDVQQPQKQTAVVLASDLIIARIEMNMLLTNEHPFLIFHSSPDLSGMGQSSPAEKMGRGTGSVSLLKNTERGHCEVCSEQNVTVLCKECEMQFCKECDERWHSHKLRLSHFRDNLLNPVHVHEEKSEKDKTDVRRRPVPVPRRRKVQKPDNESAPVSRQQPITTQPISSYTTLSSHTSPLEQQIRHPPPRSSPGQSPVNGSLLNASHNLRASEPQGRLPLSPPFSSGGPTLAQTRMGAQGNVMTPQSWQMQARSSQPQTISPPSAAVGNEKLFGCPNCSYVVSSTQPLCPNCKYQLVQNSPKNTNMSPYGMTTTVPFRSSGGKTSQDSDKFRGGYSDIPSRQKELSLARRKLPDRPDEKGSGKSFTSPANSSSRYEEVMPMQKLGDQSKDGWVCEHCTFLNPLTTQVCDLCCKTPSELKKHPSVTGKVPPIGSSNSANQLPLPVAGKIQRGIDPEVTPLGVYSTLPCPPSEALYMTPKTLPLEGGIYMVPKDQPPPLPPKNSASGRTQLGGHVVNAQKSREQELSEKEKGKKLSEQKYNLLQSGQITEDEYYNPDLLEERHFDMARLNEPQPNHQSEEQLKQQFLQAGVITQDDIYNNDRMWNRVAERPNKPELRSENELKLSDEELFKLLGDEVAPRDNLPNGNVQIEKPRGTESKLTYDEYYKLYEAGMISLETLNNGIAAPQNSDDQVYQVPKMAQRPDPKQVGQAEIQAMFEEYHRIHTKVDETGNTFNYPIAGINKSGFPHVQNFNVTRDVYPAPINLFDKTFFKSADMPAPSSKINSEFLSLPSNLGSHSFIEGQSRVYVEWMKEAESHGFTPEELNLATNLSWQDPKGRNPVDWLKEEWTARFVEVIGKVTESTQSENDRIGNLSTEEAKKALLESDGNVQSACKACIESRREKLAKIGEIAGFGRGDHLSALDNNKGDLDKAIVELEKKALEPIRKRILGNEDGGDGQNIERDNGEMNSKFIALISNDSISFERRVRVLFAEKNGKKLVSWGRAETAVKLIDMTFSVEDSIEAAEAYGDMERSLNYLNQECPVCISKKPMSQMITFLMCQDRICKDCVSEHLTLVIKEKNIHNLVCPVCGLPDIPEDAEATEYFNNLDIMIRQIVDKDVHDLFQQKLRDRSLRKEPNFRWCAHCSYGFINEQPEVNKMKCRNCEQFTCFTCKKKWAEQHEGISCEQFARWQEENDNEFQLEGLAGHLARHGIDCPQCKCRYDLAKGGCMHFKCSQCSHEFCSGCSNPFKHGARCPVSESCARKGIHAHHPRDCLFYLRDWTPVRLQGLLDANGVDYNEGEEENGEVGGAVGGAVALCKLMEQKDTPEGLVDAACGSPCEAGHPGLCKMHFTEYLVSLIKENDIDPAGVMDADEMTIVLRRAEVEPVAREQGEDENLYRERIFNILSERLPLRGRQDVEQQENQPEELQPILV